MRINSISKNETEVTFYNGLIVFFSYGTPVAAFCPDRGWLRSSHKHSKTTSRHVNRWLEGSSEVREISQDEMDHLVEKV